MYQMSGVLLARCGMQYHSRENQTVPAFYWEEMMASPRGQAQSVIDGTVFYDCCCILRKCTRIKQLKGMGLYVVGGMSSGL